MASIQDLCDAFRLTQPQERLYRKLRSRYDPRSATQGLKPLPNEKVPLRKLVAVRLAHEDSAGRFFAGFGWEGETLADFRSKLA